MPAIDLSILNQRQTPAFYADTLANRPAAGFIGRIFVSTNTFAFFRDNGTGWDLIGGPGTGTVTGSGAAGQVSFWNGANTITGSNDLFWDSVNGHLGIGTNVPGTALQIDHDQNQFIRLNQTTATNDTKIAFQNSGVALWRIGNSYNAGANDFGIYDVVGAIQPVTVKKTTGQVLIGTSTVGSGKLVVASATGDNGIQIVGATAPSLRIDNAESGPTKRAGFGISTATNNFIQGSADRDFCMFNGSTTPSPILFGIYGTTNVQEAARISAARNFLIGTTTDGGQKLQVNGRGYINDTLILDGTNTGQYLNFYNSGVDRAHIYWHESINYLSIGTYVAGGAIQFEVGNNVDAMFLNSSGNLGLGVQPSAWGAFKPSLQVGTASLAQIANRAYLTANGYFNGTNWTYIANDFASQYFQQNSEHIWNTAASGTGGNAISFNQAMTLNASGNLGLGVTPSAWSTYKAFELPNVGFIASAGEYIQMIANGVYNGTNYTYKTSNVATMYAQAVGQHQWFSAPSGTAGNTFTFTQPMTLAATGNLLIGTTTDNGNKLQVNGVIYSTNSGNNYQGIYADGTNDAGLLLGNGSTAKLYIYKGNDDRFEIFSVGRTGSAGAVMTINYTGTQIEFITGAIKTVAPSGGSAQFWKLGNYTAGVAVQAGKVRVEINGVAYDLLTA
jgi:hypothetical protein